MLTRLQIMCMTPKTRLEYDGQKITRAEQSIHATTQRKIRSKLCTMPARLRDGKNINGGRHLRRASKNLMVRRDSFESMDATRVQPSHTKPGSMR